MLGVGGDVTTAAAAAAVVTQIAVLMFSREKNSLTANVLCSVATIIGIFATAAISQAVTCK